MFDVEDEVKPVCGDAAMGFGLVEEFCTSSLLGESHKVQFCHLT